MFFKLILESGHVGAGKSYEMVRYLQGRDIFSVLFSAAHFPRVKKKRYQKGIKLIQEITKGEYIQGRMKERDDPYLNTHRKKAKRASRNAHFRLPLGRVLPERASPKSKQYMERWA
ncbi:MAG: hypothetical protein GTO13_10195 [Proteobacteria bacterium]|nr:hypothetical protein [Pseudomonadota bacterium]